MSQDRLVELVAMATEDRAGAAELSELDALASSDAGAARLLAAHLAIDDILSQQLAPERGAEAFLAGFRERVRIAEDGDSFRAKVMAAIDRELPWHQRMGEWGLRAGGLAAAAVLAIGLLSLLLAGAESSTPQPPHAVDGITALQQPANPSVARIYAEVLGRAQ